MKLHLPLSLRLSLLAFVSVYAFSAAVASGAGIATYTTTYEKDGITYAGDIIEYSDKNAIFHEGTFAFNANSPSAGSEKSQDWWKYFIDNTHNTNQSKSYGNTLLLKASTSETVTAKTEFDPFVLGGLIVEDCDTTFTLGRSDRTAVSLKAGEGNAVNMSVAADVELLGSSFKVLSSGTWNVAAGKTLTFSSGGMTIDESVTVTIGGNGSVVLAAGGTMSGEMVNNANLTLKGTWNVTTSKNGLCTELSLSDIGIKNTNSGTVSAEGTSWVVNHVSGYTYSDGKLIYGGADATLYYINSGEVVYGGVESAPFDFTGADTLRLNGGTLKLAGNLGTEMTGGIQVANSLSTLVLGKGVELDYDKLAFADSSYLNLGGKGKLTMTASQLVNVGSSEKIRYAGDWAGILRLAGGTVTNLDIDVLAPSADATLELDGVSGYLKYENGQNKEHAGKISLVGDGLTLDDGYTKDAHQFTGTISGAGKLVLTRQDNGWNDFTHHLHFSGDTSAWSGDLTVQSVNNGVVIADVEFSTASIDNKMSVAANAAGNKTGVFNLTLSREGEVSVKKEVDVNSLTIKEGAIVTFKSAVAADTLTSSGQLIVDTGVVASFGGGTLSQSLTNRGNLTLTGTWNVTSSKTMYTDGENGLCTEFSLSDIGIENSGTLSAEGASWVVNHVSGYTYSDGKLSHSAHNATWYYINSGEVVYGGVESDPFDFTGADTLCLNGGTLKLAGNLDTEMTGGIQVANSPSSLVLGKGVELDYNKLAFAASSYLNLGGKGQLTMTASQWGNVGSSKKIRYAGDWAGILRLAGGTVKDLDIDVLAPSADATLELDGVSGYLKNENGQNKEHAGKISLVGDGLTLDDGYSKDTNQFTGTISGTGKLVLTRQDSGGNALTHHLHFSGDTSAWSGDLTVQSVNNGVVIADVEFSTASIDNKMSVAANAAGNKTGVFNLTLSREGEVSVKKEVDVNSLTIKEGAIVTFKSAVAADTLTSSGQLIVDTGVVASFGGGTLSQSLTNKGNLTLTGSWILDMDATASWSDGGNGFELSADSFVFASGSGSVDTEGVTQWQVSDRLLETGSYTVNGGVLTLNGQMQVGRDYYINSGTVTYDASNKFDAECTTDATQLVLNGGALKMDVSLDTSKTSGIRVVGADSQITIGEKVSLDYGCINFAAEAGVVLSGSGELLVQNNTAFDGSLSSLSFGDDWSGKLHLKNVTTTGEIDGGLKMSLVDGRYSQLVLEGVTGQLSCEGQNTSVETTLSHSVNLKLTGDGLTLSDGYTNIAHEFTGTVEGNGQLVLKNQCNHKVIFAGSVADWTGNIVMKPETANSNSMVTFTGGATAINIGSISTERTATGTIVFDHAAAVSVGTELNGHLDVRVNNTAAAGTTFSNGVMDIDSLSVESGTKVAVQSGTVSIQSLSNAGNVAFTGVKQLELSALNLKDGSTLSAEQVKVTGSAVLEGGSVVDGSLDLSGVDSIEFDVAEEAVIVYGDLVLASLGELPQIADYTEMLDNLLQGQNVNLFTVAGSVTLGDVILESGYCQDVSFLFDGMNPGDCYLRYDAALGKAIGGTLYLSTVPEPSTAILSLLSLASLAARRRRK